MKQIALSALSLILVAGLIGCGGGTGRGAESTSATRSSVSPCARSQWLDVWSASPTDSLDVEAGRTLRTVISPHRGGSTLRVRISNRLSATSLMLNTPTIARSDGGGGTLGAPLPLMFSGRPALRVPAGGVQLSDPVRLDFEPFEKLAISAYVPRAATLTRHLVALQDSWLSPPGAGDLAASAGAGGFTESAPSSMAVDRLQVRSRADAQELVAFGDSLTDGFGSPAGADERYPDYLQRRLASIRPDVSVLTAGISGNRLATSSLTGMGPSGLRRFDSDVLTLPDARDVIIEAGITDIAGGAGASRVIADLRRLVTRAERAGVAPILATLAPDGPASGTEDAARRRVNAWIRSRSGLPVADFDLALADPDDPSELQPAYDSGDGLHPNAAGYERMAAAVEPDAISSSSCSPARP